MTDFWLSTTSPRRIFRPARLTKAREARLRELSGLICHGQIAIEFGLPPNVIESWQRYLGLRPITRSRKATQIHGGRKRKAK